MLSIQIQKKIKLKQKKLDGGIIKLNYLKIYVSLFFIFFTSNVFAKNINIIRDSEIEFFLQNLINNFSINEDIKNSSIKPLIVIDNSMNAFVTGNNYIYIHTGLLENLDSYEELEGIIAHEIGHLKLGHVESRKILSKKTGWWNN